MPNDTNPNNPNSQNTTKSDDIKPTAGVTPSIQTEYFDVPPPPQVTKEGQNPPVTEIPDPTTNTPPISENVKVEPPPPSPTPTTQVMGSTNDNPSTNEMSIADVTKPVTSFKPKGRGRKILVPTILGILFLAGGLAAGVLLIRQNQDVRERADTQVCTGCMDAGGNCIELGSTTNSQCGSGGELCVSCLASQTCTSGSCTAPQPTVTPVVIPIQCLSVEAYKVDENSGIENASSWTKLTQNDLSKLTSGSYVYFTVTGKDTSGDTTKFTKARFKVNNENFVQVDAATNTKPSATSDSTNEIKIYYKYRIPANTKQFEVKAAIYHSDQEWIDSIE